MFLCVFKRNNKRNKRKNIQGKDKFQDEKNQNIRKSSLVVWLFYYCFVCFAYLFQSKNISHSTSDGNKTGSLRHFINIYNLINFIELYSFLKIISTLAIKFYAKKIALRHFGFYIPTL